MRSLVDVSASVDSVCIFINRDIVSDLSIVKLVDDSTPNVGDTINFTLEITNAGPDPAINVVVDDPLSSGYSFVAGSITGGDAQNQTALNLQWTINSLDVGVAYTKIMQYQVIVNSLP